jgi:hypothetical protein
VAQGPEADALDSLLGDLIVGEAAALATVVGYEAQIAAGVFEAPTAPASGVAAVAGATGTRATGFYTYGVRGVGPGGESETTLVSGLWTPDDPLTVTEAASAGGGALVAGDYAYRVVGAGPAGSSAPTVGTGLWIPDDPATVVATAAGNTGILAAGDYAYRVSGVGPGGASTKTVGTGNWIPDVPVSAAGVAAGADGVLAAHDYMYSVKATGPGGDSAAVVSAEVAVGATNHVTLTITKGAGTTPNLYKISRITSAAGVPEGPFVEIGRILDSGAATTVFTDDGSDDEAVGLTVAADAVMWVAATQLVSLLITKGTGTLAELYSIERAPVAGGVIGAYAEIGRILDSGGATTTFVDDGTDAVGMALVAAPDPVMWVLTAEKVVLTITKGTGVVPDLYRIYRAPVTGGSIGTYAEIGRILDSGGATTVFTDDGSDTIGMTLTSTADSIMFVTLGEIVTLTITPATGNTPTLFKVYRSAINTTTPLTLIGRVLCGPTTTLYVDNGTDGVGSTLTSLTIAGTLSAARAILQRIQRGVEVAKIHLEAALRGDK